MSEYWVSTKKYWCKHCSTFVKDTPLSRQQHDATPKHQGSLKRFLRDLHRGKEKDALAAENAKREADRLNNLGDLNSAKPLKALPRANSTAGSSKSHGPRIVTEDQRRRNLEELAALGVAMPEDYRKDHAMVGEWQTVRVIEEQEVKNEDGEEEQGGTEIVVAGGRDAAKGKLEENDDNEELEGQPRRLGTSMKEYPVDNGLDLDELMGKTQFKGKKRAAPLDDKHAIKREKPVVETKVKEENIDLGLNFKREEDDASEDIKKEDDRGIKAEEGTDSTEGGFAFKKRKMKNNRRSALS